LKIKYTILLLVLFYFGCKENIPLDPTNNKGLVVIEGLITNDIGPYTIKVSTSSNLDDPKVYPLKECLITIIDNHGLEEVLIETEPGIYISRIDGIKGVIGNKYKLSVVTKDNVRYETDFHELLEPLEMKSIYADTTSFEVLNDPVKLEGYQFFVDTELASTFKTYLLWKVTETYEYTADYIIYAYFDGELKIANQDTIINYEDTYRCWSTEKRKEIFTAEMANLTYPQILNKKLHFVSTNSRKLKIKYSSLISQFTIDEQSYRFWKGIEDQMSEEGVLYASQPSNITSNIQNINNPEEVVLGYFTVASVSKKRLFIDNVISTFNYEKCYTITDLTVMFDMLRPIPRYFVILDGGDMGEVRLDCFDCTNNGGELNKPDYWIDN